MKIIITDRFEKEYLKPLAKYFRLLDLVENLRKKEHTFIELNRSFKKYKLKINNVDFRGIIFLIIDGKIVPLMIYLKKDKKFGMNLSWEQSKQIIIKEHNLATKDIEKGNFKIF